MAPLFAPFPDPTPGALGGGSAIAPGPRGAVGFGLQYVDVLLSAAQIIASFSTAVTLIPAPGPNRAIFLWGVFWRYFFGGTPFNPGPSTILAIDTPAQIALAAERSQTQAQGFLDQGNNMAFPTNPNTNLAVPYANVVNLPFVLQTLTTAMTLGNGSIKLTCYYTIEPTI